MNVIEAIRTKRAVRRSRDEPLPDDIVRAILRADAESRRGRKVGRRQLDDVVRWERW
ncbi:MAG: hypothetical protein OXU81_22055 [Gammaproteobacteria bacterium]|nr:hypothetical protein [Gammaproteobacteria bacterium]